MTAWGAANSILPRTFLSVPEPLRTDINNSVTGQNAANDEIVRKYYAAWENKDLDSFNALLADNFTFSSAAGDDHISKSTFKTQC